jgi:glycosyltransferase involved in cell wall biosynthesis
MKILVLADVLFPDTIGGAGRVAYNLSLELAQKGHDVHIITRNINGQFPGYQVIDTNLYVHRFFIPSNQSSSLFFSEIKNSYLLAKILKENVTFDLICIHQSLVSMGPLLSCRFKNIPVIHYFHSPWHEEYLIKISKPRKRDNAVARAMRLIEKRIMLKASGIIVLSHFMRNKLLEIHNPHCEISIIPAGVDLDDFHLPDSDKASAKQKTQLASDKTIFLTVRNLVPRMGLETLIETFNRSKTLRKNSILLLGGRGNLEHRLKSMVDKLGLRDTVHFLDHIPDEDLPGIYQAADYFVLPTEKLEGFGLVILEAMACGTPVLGTPVGAIPEIIGQFDKRLIFKGTNWEDIKEKMEDIIERPDLYYFDPKACRKFVQENYSWKKAANDFEEVAIRLMT